MPKEISKLLRLWEGWSDPCDYVLLLGEDTFDAFDFLASLVDVGLVDTGRVDLEV